MKITFDIAEQVDGSLKVESYFEGAGSVSEQELCQDMQTAVREMLGIEQEGADQLLTDTFGPHYRN